MTTGKAVLRVLAHTYATGSFPSHIHAGTYMAALDFCIEGHYSPRKLTEEGLALIANHPVKLAHDWAVAHGYVLINRVRRRSSHSISYYHGDRDKRELSVYRSGDATIWGYDEGGPPYRNYSQTNQQLLERTEP